MNRFRSKLLGSGGFLVLSLVLSNGLNLLFNAYLARYLSLTQFSLLTVINTFLYISTILITALGTTVSHRVAFITARQGVNAGFDFFRSMMRNGLTFSLFISLALLLLSPFLQGYFKLATPIPLLIFIPVLITGILGSITSGYLSGKFLFFWAGILFLSEAVLKILLVSVFVYFDLKDFVYLSIPFSSIGGSLFSLLLTFFIARKSFKTVQTHAFRFPSKFFLAALTSYLSKQAFLTFDVLLVAHYFSANESGKYALASLIGKMVYFFGSLFSIFLVPLISREEGSHRSSLKSFYILFLITFGLTSLAVAGLIIVGPIVLPFIFGDKISQISYFLNPYILAISMYTLTNSITTYHLTRHHYFFAFNSLFMTAVMAILLNRFHSSLSQVVFVLLGVSLANLLLTSLFHLLQRNGGFIVANIVDLYGLISPVAKPSSKKKRILIFNWYDIRHVWAGGAEQYVHTMAKALVEKGNHVTMFCGNDGHSKRYEVIDGIRIIRRGGLFTVPVWAFLYYILKFRNSYDLVIDSAKGVPFFTPLYIKKPIVGLVCHIHQEMFRRGLPFPIAQISMFLEEKLMPRVYRDTQMLTISNSTRTTMEKMGFGVKRPIYVVEPGVSIKKAKVKKTIYPSIIYLGRLRNYKNIDIAIKAVNQLVKRYKKIQLVIAGDGENKLKLQELVSKLGLENNVTFTSKITEDQKAKLLTQSWIAIHPSEVEGWGITNIEANICGTPVIASNVDGLKDSVIANETGLLVKVRNVSEFASAIKLLISNQTLRTRFSKAGEKWAAQFNWKETAKKTLQLFDLYLIHNATYLDFKKLKNV